MANEHIGRRISVGIGKEDPRGTAVVPTHWVKHLDLSFQQMSEAVNNESALGVVEQINDSAIARKWAEGSINGKITDQTIGLILLATFGEVASVESADTGVFDHAYTVAQTNLPPTLTVSRVDPLQNISYARGTVSRFALTNTAGEYVQFETDFLSETSEPTTNTPAFIEEFEFTSKDVTVKIADTRADLVTAEPIPVSNISLEIQKNGETYFSMGDVNPTEITTNSVGVTGEMTLRYTSTEYEQLYFDATKKWLEISLINKNETIGASSNPSLIFTMSKVAMTEWSLEQGLDEIVTQTLGFTAQYSTDEAQAVEATLKNTAIEY